LSDYGLAYYGHRVTRPDRPSLARQTVAWILVALVHAFLLTMFIMSEFLPADQLRKPSPIETMFLLAMRSNMPAPPIKIIKPEVPTATVPTFTTAPLVVVPMPEPPMIQPETPADILKAIGEALACSANSFENLTESAREHCRHPAWQARQQPDGTLVLDTPSKLPAQQQQAQIHLNGADQMRHDMETGPACPVLQQAPCLHDVITGNNMKPF
jgi:hypothetical protein